MEKVVQSESFSIAFVFGKWVGVRDVKNFIKIFQTLLFADSIKIFLDGY